MDNFFIEEVLSSSEDEADYRWKSRKYREDSPQAIHAFPLPSGGDKRRDQSPDSSSLSEGEVVTEDDSEAEDSDQSVEEWMVIDELVCDGDSNIQLNLSYSISSDEDIDEKDMSSQDLWAVSKKDMGTENRPVCRYYTPGFSLLCPICKRTGHIAKNCPLQKKAPVCELCGVQGHFQKHCLSRPCSRCGLLSHGLRICDRPPVWNQHCQRCGMTGHLSDTCPDNWRQFHHTITMVKAPKIQATRAFKPKKRPAYCYNCSRRGHYGYECRERRMVSGVFIALPYVCHYGIFVEGLHQINAAIQDQNTDFISGAQPPDHQHLYEPSGINVKEDRLFQKNKMKQQSRKTWPERRKERREVKRLRREAQARREGGVLGQCLYNPDDETLYSDPFGTNHYRQTTCALNKTKKKVEVDRRSRKIKEAERWKKRGGIKRGFLRPHKEMDICSEILFSPKQRVRHRRK